LFGNVLHGEMVLNESGTIVRDEWLKTAEIRDNIKMDGFVVMPNHVHGIFLITGFAGTARRAPTTWNTLTDPGAGFSSMFDFKEIGDAGEILTFVHPTP